MWISNRVTALLAASVLGAASCGPPPPPMYPNGRASAFSAPTAVPPPPGLPPEQPMPFVLAPGDVVNCRLVSTDALEGTATVDGTGSLHVPIAGAVAVGGLSLAEAERRADAALRLLDRFGHVVLTVTEAGGHRATVVGAVVHPGVIPVRANMRVAELLAAAGGERVGAPEQGESSEIELADLDAARVIRDGQVVPISVPLALTGDPRHNVYIHPGDMLLVPPARGRRVVVLGNVRTPRVVRFRSGMRLTEALAAAGGGSERANEGSIHVVRGPLSRPQVYQASLTSIIDGVAPDVELAPGDVLYVTPHWFFGTVGDVLNRLLPLAATATIIYGVVR